MRPITSRISLEKYRKEKIAVDAMCWLHRGAIACSMDLALGKSPGSHFVHFFMKMVHLLFRFQIHPIIVFDGTTIPAKDFENKNRTEKRYLASKKAKLLLDSGVSKFDKSVRQKASESVFVTNEMKLRVMHALYVAGVEFLVAPFEADAQLAYLCRNNLVKAVITEDSDLLVYGCPRVIFKLNEIGDAQEIDMSSISFKKHHVSSNDLSDSKKSKNECPVIPISHVSYKSLNSWLTNSSSSQNETNSISNSINDEDKMLVSSHIEKVDDEDFKKKILKCELEKISFPMFIFMCVLSGCDYTQDVHINGLGLKLAYDFILKYKSLNKVFDFIYSSNNWKRRVQKNIDRIEDSKHNLTKFEFIEFRHYMATFIFENHYVYDPRHNAIVSVSAIGEIESQTPCLQFNHNQITIESSKILGKALHGLELYQFVTGQFYLEDYSKKIQFSTEENNAISQLKEFKIGNYVCLRPNAIHQVYDSKKSHPSEAMSTFLLNQGGATGFIHRIKLEKRLQYGSQHTIVKKHKPNDHRYDETHYDSNSIPNPVNSSNMSTSISAKDHNEQTHTDSDSDSNSDSFQNITRLTRKHHHAITPIKNKNLAPLTQIFGHNSFTSLSKSITLPDSILHNMTNEKIEITQNSKNHNNLTFFPQKIQKLQIDFMSHIKFKN